MSAPAADCPLCPRLVAFREANRVQFPGWHNAPVPSFGAMDAQLLVVGLAPGLKGANATGRPFTGDYAGLVLYGALKRHGFAEGSYAERADDGFTLVNCRITNAVRCVPPENKPETGETKHCNAFLKNEIAAMQKLRVILSLGNISHAAVLRALGLKAGAYTFTHAMAHKVQPGLTLLNSYHTSRYNMNTRRLTESMFDDVVKKAKALLA